MTYAPPALVVGAARLPLPFGLFSTFTLRGPSGGDRWPLGVQWETGTCDWVDGIGDVDCGHPEIVRITISGPPNTGTWTLDWENKGPTAGLAIGATAQQVEDALNEFVTGGVDVSGQAGGPFTITFRTFGNKATFDTSNTFDTGLLAAVVQQQGDNYPGPNIGMPKDLDSNSGDLGLATPFTVYGHFTCSPVGYPLAAAQDLATAHLLNREEQRVEQAFWTCDLGNAPGLACSTPFDVSEGVGGDPVCYGIGALEAYLATNYGNLGVIHMTRATALAAIAAECVTSTGGRLFTALGTPVAAGSGYPGTSPLGQPAIPGTAWMYATPALFGYRSEVFTSTAVPGDRFTQATNDLMAVAERTYLLGYDPCGTATVLVKYADLPEGPQ